MSFLSVAAALLAVTATLQTKDRLDNRGFVNIFDGKTLAGWRVSGKTGHGTGGKWVVERGAITGTQDLPGNGGIILTEREYGDFEVVLEMRNDYGPDSGLFLRSNEEGQCYQAMIDFHNEGNLMGIYGEGIGGFVARNYIMQQTEESIRVEPYPPFPLPFKPDRWTRVWKPGKWNELRARIERNPPKIITWVNGVRIMEWEDTQKRLPDRGRIALQVHGGSDYTNQFVRYRKIRVKELN